MGGPSVGSPAGSPSVGGPSAVGGVVEVGVVVGGVVGVVVGVGERMALRRLIFSRARSSVIDFRFAPFVVVVVDDDDDELNVVVRQLNFFRTSRIGRSPNSRSNCDMENDIPSISSTGCRHETQVGCPRALHVLENSEEW